MKELQKNVNSFLTTTADYRDTKNVMNLFFFHSNFNFIYLETIANSQCLQKKTKGLQKHRIYKITLTAIIFHSFN